MLLATIPVDIDMLRLALCFIDSLAERVVVLSYNRAVLYIELGEISSPKYHPNAVNQL